jgi:3',5'-nucleoside bisphosphate phosphatase
MRADLHIHTTSSDGSWSPEEVVRAAAAGGLDVISITDHDTTSGVPAALAAAADEGIRVVPGVELSTTFGRRDVHLLAYFVDLDAPALREHQTLARGGRLRRIETMVSRLRASGVLVDLDSVLQSASGEGGVVGRPHLARALVAAGHATSVNDAFNRFIGDGLPAFEPIALLDPVGGVDLARASGGLAVWAHPPSDLLDVLLPELCRAGLAGIEVYRPFARPDDVRRLEKQARSSELWTTGGSDWHGPERGDALGAFAVSGEQIGPFLKAGGL